MERTESKVVQAAPSAENHKIQEMQAFGWNLVNRQELVEEGNTYGTISSSGVSSTTQIHKYVKLHFQRNMALPNIEKIKALESEHESIGYVSAKTSLKWPLIIVVFGVVGFMANISNNPGGAFVIGGLLIAGGGYWAYSRVQRGQAAEATNAEGESRRRDLERAAQTLMA